MTSTKLKHRREYNSGRQAFSDDPCFNSFRGLNRCPYKSGEGAGSENSRRIAWMDGWLDERLDQKYELRHKFQ